MPISTTRFLVFLKNNDNPFGFDRLILCCFLNFFFTFSLNSSIAQEASNKVNFSAHQKLHGYGAKKRNNPAVFQGNNETANYFEGWYFKMVSEDESAITSIIPGISLSENGDTQHAFIQIIDGKTAETSYYSYPIEDFFFSSSGFEIWIGDNYFSENGLVIDIKDDSTSIQGKVDFSNQVHLTKNNKKKKEIGIMGWYRKVPFMECYHGVVSLNHDLAGKIQIDNKIVDFENGAGYIEKDWGESMPSSWIWIQSNNFGAENTSFMLSVANVPWLGSSFTGFLGFFLNDTVVHRFGTYTHAKLEIELTETYKIKLKISDKKYTYLIETYRNSAGILQAPVNGSMDRRISEGIDAHLLLTVLDKKGKQIFKDATTVSGLEMVGDLNELLSKKQKRKK